MIRTILTVFVLATPFAAQAECPYDHQQAMSCADGQVWDKASKSCTAATG